MKISESAQTSGWRTYPSALWDGGRDVFSPEQIPFWRHCAGTYGAPILDLCCGNGRYSIALAAMGYEVVGVDLNEGLVARARARARAALGPDALGRISFQVSDVVNLDVGSRFRLAIMPGWSFQVLLTQEDQIAFFHALRGHLLPGGAFAFNLFAAFYRQQGLSCVGGVYQWKPDPAYHRGALRTFDPLTHVESFAESGVHAIRLRHTNLSELRLLLRGAGFEVAEMYGDDADMRPFTGGPGDDYVIVAEARGDAQSAS